MSCQVCIDNGYVCDALGCEIISKLREQVTTLTAELEQSRKQETAAREAMRSNAKSDAELLSQRAKELATEKAAREAAEAAASQYRERIGVEESARAQSETLLQQTGWRLSKLQEVAAASCALWERTDNASLHEIRTSMRALRVTIGEPTSVYATERAAHEATRARVAALERELALAHEGKGHAWCREALATHAVVTSDAQAEADALRAKLERVQAIAQDWAQKHNPGGTKTFGMALLDALTSDTQTPEPPALTEARELLVDACTAAPPDGWIERRAAWLAAHPKPGGESEAESHPCNPAERPCNCEQALELQRRIDAAKAVISNRGVPLMGTGIAHELLGILDGKA